MRNPVDYISDRLGALERRWVPYRSIWWRLWSPKMGRQDRYQDGYFDGYGALDDDNDNMHALDIRWAVANPFLRKIYKALPYIDVVPVRRPVQDMSEEMLRKRTAFVISVTHQVYNEGKALYTRSMIQDVENQLNAPGWRHRGRLARRLLEACEAPQTAWVKYTDFDGVVQHQGTWMPGATNPMGDVYSVFGRSQIEFRTIQELTMPDPDNVREVFAPDQWEPSVAFNTISVCSRCEQSEMARAYGDETDQLSADELKERLIIHRNAIAASDEWLAICASLLPRERKPNETIKSIDKIVFFYSTGLSDDCDFCKRAMFLLAMATRIRDLVMASRAGTDNRRSLATERLSTPGTASDTSVECSANAQPYQPYFLDHLSEGFTDLSDSALNCEIPIFMPAFDINRTWNESELSVLRAAGVKTIESNGELFLKIDARTAVISYRHWNPVKQVVADLTRPALFVCKPPTSPPSAHPVTQEPPSTPQAAIHTQANSLPVAGAGEIAGSPSSPTTTTRSSSTEDSDSVDYGIDFSWRYENRDVDDNDGQTNGGGPGTSRVRTRIPRVRVRDVDNSILSKDPDSPRTRAMLDTSQQCDKYVLPKLPGETARKEVLSLFVKKDGAPREVEYWS